MGIFGRMFGKKGPQAAGEQSQPPGSIPAAPPTPRAEIAPSPEQKSPAAAAAEPAAPQTPTPMRLQVLFPRPPQLDGQTLVRLLERMHPSFRGAKLEVIEDQDGARGLASFANHAVEILVRTHALPKDAAEYAIGLAQYKPELKDIARAHGAYLVLNYQGQEKLPWEQLIALAAVAALLTQQGATTIVNVDAFTSVPASVLEQIFKSPDPIGMLRLMPPAALYCGFVKYSPAGDPGVWMRTHGCQRLGLPNLAIHRDSHAEGEKTFQLFNAVLNHMRENNQAFLAGQTLQVGGTTTVNFRDPRSGEPFEEKPGELLILETQEIGNQPAMTSM
ncbi:MAG TPA: DUF4261 domain-containing protein [Tepidisphaeraceae bacterium]|nr:DUF4261 domain-containing protein [Tepidisphaeraceae bacterium]